MKTLICSIKDSIEEKLNEGFRNFIIFPYGDVGMRVKYILNEAYGIREAHILDNKLCKYNETIHELDFCVNIDCSQYCIILACTNPVIYNELKKSVKKYFGDRNIAEFFTTMQESKYVTKVGKYSYGPICRNHPYIESIGAFCSFSFGVEVVGNHEMRYITTHPMISAGLMFNDNVSNTFIKYNDHKGEVAFFDGINPLEQHARKIKRCKIGNDVWLGRNVIVTNYADIGNGVIAGAGAVITKDVPDYAIVVGAPARIIKYRFSENEIESLNKIAWWNWSDEVIRERYEDLHIPIKEFIEKYGGVL